MRSTVQAFSIDGRGGEQASPGLGGQSTSSPQFSDEANDQASDNYQDKGGAHQKSAFCLISFMVRIWSDAYKS